jgi:hypothetical protein
MDETVDKVEITMRTVYIIDTSDRWILVAMPCGVYTYCRVILVFMGGATDRSKA